MFVSSQNAYVLGIPKSPVWWPLEMRPSGSIRKGMKRPALSLRHVKKT